MFIDIIVGVVLLISAVIAFIRGFIREVLTIAGVVGGLAAAYMGGGLLSPVFRGWFGIEEGAEAGKLLGIVPYAMLADGLAYVSIFLVVVIAISIISHFLAEGLRSLGMGAIDRTFGVIFGLLRGVLLLGLFYLPFYLFVEPESKESFFEGSKTHLYLEGTAGFLAKFVPEGTKETVEGGAKQAGDVITTKGKLQEMHLLQKDGGDGSEAEEGDAVDEPGYQEPFRDDLNDLFRKQQLEDDFNE